MFGLKMRTALIGVTTICALALPASALATNVSVWAGRTSSLRAVSFLHSRCARRIGSDSRGPLERICFASSIQQSWRWSMAFSSWTSCSTVRTAPPRPLSDDRKSSQQE